MSSEIAFALEGFDRFYPECLPLWQKHYEMVALNKDAIPLKPNVDRYRSMEKSGCFHLITARRGGKLVGYYLGMSMPFSLHYSIKEAYCDIYFMDCEDAPFSVVARYRALARFVVKYLKSTDVVRIHIVTKIAHDISKIWESIGFRKSEVCHVMML